MTVSGSPGIKATYRIAPALAALFLFLLLSALYVSGATHWYAWIMEHWGVAPFPSPFVDLHALFASWECTRQGFDVFSRNPCDVLARRFDYSPLLLSGWWLEFGVAWTESFGLVLDFLFFASLTLLPPVRRPWELLAVVMASVSTMVAFAAERANLDIVVFMLALAIGFLALDSLPRRWFAYPIAVFAAIGMKYYPITLMILALRERVSVFLAVCGAAVCIVGVFVFAYFGDLQKGWALLGPSSYYRDLFGAENLPMGLVGGSQGSTNGPSSPSMGRELIADAILATLLLIGAAISWLILRSADFRQAFSSLAPEESIFLVIGSVLIVGCFFAGQSTSYRGIFLLLAIPGLLAIGRNAKGRPMRWIAACTVATIVFIMWGECIRANLAMAARASQPAPNGIVALATGFWLLRECAWWWVIGILTTALLAFAMESRAGSALLSAFGFRVASSRGWAGK